jgi:chitinase
LDIETSTTEASILRLVQALYKDMGPSFIITLAPVPPTFTNGPQPLSGNFNYTTLDNAAVAPDKPRGKIINWFNLQFYCNCFSNTNLVTGYTQVINTGWDPARMVLGVETFNPGGDTLTFEELPKYEADVKTLVKKYPQFGGVVGWEYKDAGLNDPTITSRDDRWKWVQGIGNALFGNSTS